MYYFFTQVEAGSLTFRRMHSTVCLNVAPKMENFQVSTLKDLTNKRGYSGLGKGILPVEY